MDMGTPEGNSTLHQMHSYRRALFTSLLLTALALAVLVGSALAAAIVKNGSFEKGSGGIPKNWLTYGFTSKDKRVCNQSKVGNCSLKQVGDGNYKQFLQDTFPVGDAGDTVLLTFWAKTKALVEGTDTIHLFVNVIHVDDSFDQGTLSLPEGDTPWTLYTVDVPVAEPFHKVELIFDNYLDSGKVWCCHRARVFFVTATRRSPTPGCGNRPKRGR
jgi:hypothetical protein